jgi:predicted XRE-type DNA-binding protein
MAGAGDPSVDRSRPDPNHPHRHGAFADRFSDGDASLRDDSATRSARRALITAITGRITQQRLTAAQAAALLHLTGPKVTKQGNVDEFTLDALVNLLPPVELTIHVVPAPQRRAVTSARERRTTCDLRPGRLAWLIFRHGAGAV